MFLSPHVIPVRTCVLITGNERITSASQAVLAIAKESIAKASGTFTSTCSSRFRSTTFTPSPLAISRTPATSIQCMESSRPGKSYPTEEPSPITTLLGPLSKTNFVTASIRRTSVITPEPDFTGFTTLGFMRTLELFHSTHSKL